MSFTFLPLILHDVYYYLIFGLLFLLLFVLLSLQGFKSSLKLTFVSSNEDVSKNY